MSYSVYLTINTGDEERVDVRVLDANCTYNMYYAIDHGGIDMLKPHDREVTTRFVLDGALASDAVPFLADCITTIERDITQLREQEPANGWGNVDDLLRFLRAILNGCRTHPLTTVRVG